VKEVFVYVEGPSDQLGMRELLSGIIEIAARKGNKIDFYPLGGKEALLKKGPKKAINILRNRPNSWVFLLPDLYPRNKPFSHENYQDLKGELDKQFTEEIQRKNCDEQIGKRFLVHCFKYDFESLLLASENILLQRLGKSKFSCKWKVPVEDQDHNNPPKRIVEVLFRDANMKYKDTADAPWILNRSNYRDLMIKCPQNFKPFIEDLFSILELESL